MKKCGRCQETKPLDEFPLSKSGTHGRYGYCLPCKSEYMREQARRRAADGSNARWLQAAAAKRYGTTIEEIDRLTEEQEGRCAICGGPPTGNHGRLAMDHNHETGLFRGLICGHCNNGLGMFKDSPGLLRKAAEYLEKRGSYGTRNH